jgi:phosphate transport system substrate-binding protein
VANSAEAQARALVVRFSHPRFGVALLGGLLISASLLVGCSAKAGVPTRGETLRQKPVVPEGGILLQGAGATFPSILYKKWFETYQAAHPKDVITYDAVGSGEGIRRFIGQGIDPEEKVDFGASDAAMRDEDIARVAGGAVLLPVTAGCVVLAYNLPGLSADLKLSREAYAGIFMGQIKNWNDVRIAKTNPGVKLPNLTITTIVRQDGSGTTFAFTKNLDAISGAWRSQFGPATLVNWPGNSMRASGNEGVAGRIRQSIGSIGYVSYEFAVRTGLKVALLENRAGEFVAPSPSRSASAFANAELPDNLRLYVPDPAGAESYPIVTLTWILLYKNSSDRQKTEVLQDLFRWCLTDGQKYAPELGYTPLPQNIVARSLVAVENLQ